MTEEEKAAAEAAAKAEKEAKERSQDVIKQELEKQAQKKVFSEKEKAAFNLKKKIEEAKALGIDPKDILGIEEDQKDEVPEWYKKEQAKNSQKTALQLADSIADPDEKALVKEYLSTRVVASGDAESDFRLAFGAVNALKNKQIIEDMNRRVAPRTVAAGGSQGAKFDEQFTPTEEEALFMKSFGLKKEQIIEVRRKIEAKQR